MWVTRETLPFKLPEILGQMLPGKAYSVEIKLHREKRSNNANAFMWALINKIAEVLRTSTDELYFQALQRYGQSFLVKVRKNQLENALRTFKYCVPHEQWSDPMGETAYLRVYRGSSSYDTKEFARLLDGIIDEARELGIDVDSDEARQLLEKWEPTWRET